MSISTVRTSTAYTASSMSRCRSTRRSVPLRSGTGRARSHPLRKSKRTRRHGKFRSCRSCSRGVSGRLPRYARSWSAPTVSPRCSAAHGRGSCWAWRVGSRRRSFRTRPLSSPRCLVVPTFGLRERKIKMLHAFWPRVAEVGLAFIIGVLRASRAAISTVQMNRFGIPAYFLRRPPPQQEFFDQASVFSASKSSPSETNAARLISQSRLLTPSNASSRAMICGLFRRYDRRSPRLPHDPAGAGQRRLAGSSCCPVGPGDRRYGGSEQRRASRTQGWLAIRGQRQECGATVVVT